MFNDLIVSHINTCILVTNADLQVLYANPSAEHFFCLSQRRLKALKFPQLFRHSSLDYTRLTQCFELNQAFTDSEVSLVTIDEAYSKAEISVSPLHKKEQTLLLIELRALDQLQKISQESFVQSQLLASRDLIRGLAHEIKNPLGGIRGAAQLLDKMLDDQDLKECTQVIIEQSDRLRNLVDRLLGPNKRTHYQVTNLHKIIEQVRQLLEMETASNIQFQRDYDPSIPDFAMDPEQIHQVILNIARNAMQAIDDSGTIRFLTRIASQQIIHGQRHKLVAILKIIDNGTGISDHIRDTLFYPMVTSKSDGSGLGLSIAQTLIQQHQGKIECESWPGHTEFIVYLPICDIKDFSDTGSSHGTN